MTLDQIKNTLYSAVEASASTGQNVCNEIFQHPELGDEEYYSSKFLTDEMKKLGFDVTYPYCGLPTAFRCEYGDEVGPKIAFLAEYDALSGYGEKKDQNGHSCGHNWIAASTLQTCVALKAIKEHFTGKIVFIGTPAEETTGRKIDIIKAGGFDDIDIAMQIHLDKETSLSCTLLACTDMTFEFKGVAAHASAYPHDGINALDACQLTFAGVNALRQHVTSDVRIHGIIKDGGDVCNTVPDLCRMEIMVRAADKNYLENVVERVTNCAKGAALMTGATLTTTRAKNTFYDLKPNDLLNQTFHDNMIEQGIKHFKTVDVYGAGSSDMGNVSYVCPTIFALMGTGAISDAKPHDTAYLDVVNSEHAYDLLKTAAKVMGATALDIYCNKELQDRLYK